MIKTRILTCAALALMALAAPPRRGAARQAERETEQGDEAGRDRAAAPDARARPHDSGRRGHGRDFPAGPDAAARDFRPRARRDPRLAEGR